MSKLTTSLLLLALCAPGVATSQQAPLGPTRHEIVRGRVSTDSGVPVSGADIVVTRTGDAASRTTTTDSAGFFAVEWTTAAGDYALTVSAPGFSRSTIHLVRGGTDTIIVGDVHLTRA